MSAILRPIATDGGIASARSGASGVSVAMATYNGARYLQAQLDSIAEQTLPPDELVVSDDGSRDETLALVRQFAQTAPFPVRILDKDARLGFADNFLFAAEQCTGAFVAFADQDDVWQPTKLERGVARLRADDSLLSMHQLQMTDAALTPTVVWKQGIDRDRVWQPLELDPWAGWGNTMIVRRELALLVPRGLRPTHPGADRPLSHDTWLYVLAAALGRVSHIAEPLILYRQHGSNVVGMAPPGWRAWWQAATRVPVESYRDRDRFFGQLADVFTDLARRERGEPAARALDAAERYGERQWRARTRIAVYDGRTPAARAAAVWRLHARRPHDRTALAVRAGSAAKDLLLGIPGWGTRI